MIDKEAKRQIENALYNYNSLKLVKDDLLEDVAFIGMTSNYNKMPGVANFGNAKENQFIKYLDKAKADKWVMVVDKTLDYFKGTGNDKILRLRYFEKRKHIYISNTLHCDPSNMYDRLNDTLNYALLIAVQYQLIKII